MKTEYLVKHQINFTFTDFLMSYVLSWLRFQQCFLMFGDKFFAESTEQQRILQIWIGKTRLSVPFNQFHRRKCFFACERYFKTKYNSERLFIVLGNFHVVRIPRNESHQKHQGWTEGKSFKLRFQYWICFEANDFHLVCYWHFHILLFQ